MTRPEVPNSHTVHGDRGNPLPIGAEGNSLDDGVVLHGRSNCFPGCHIPNLRRYVATCDHHPAPIMAKCGVLKNPSWGPHLKQSWALLQGRPQPQAMDVRTSRIALLLLQSLGKPRQ